MMMLLGIFTGGIRNLIESIMNGFRWLGSQIAEFFSWLGRLIWDSITWLGEHLGNLFSALFDLLISFFTFIFDLIGVFGYFLFQIGELAVKLFLIFFELLKLIYSFVVGLITTLQSLSYSSASTGGHGYSEMIGQVFTAMQPLQIDVIAYILLFIIWLMTAIQAIHILSTVRGSSK